MKSNWNIFLWLHIWCHIWVILIFITKLQKYNGHLCLVSYGRQHLRWPSWSLPHDIHALVEPPLLGCGLDPVAKGMGGQFRDQVAKAYAFCLALSLTPLLLREAASVLWAALWKGPHAKGLREASGQQPARSWSTAWLHPDSRPAENEATGC